MGREEGGVVAKGLDAWVGKIETLKDGLQMITDDLEYEYISCQELCI